MRPSASHRRHVCRPAGVLLTLALFAAAASSAWACEPPEGGDAPRRQHERAESRPWPVGERVPGLLPGGNPFRPLRQEEGPLEPGEAPRLMRFARERLPRVFQLLRELEQADPPAFERKLAEFAPRLRHLKRIFRENEEIGRLLVEHAENNEANAQAARAFRKLPERAAQRELTLDQVRRRIARNITIESEVFRLRIDELHLRREELIQAHADRLLAVDSPLIGEPPPVVELVARYWSEPDGVGRAAVRVEVEQWAADRVDHQLEGMTERYELVKSDEAAEVDRRMKRWHERPGSENDRAPRPHGPHSRPQRPEPP